MKLNTGRPPGRPKGSGKRLPTVVDVGGVKVPVPADTLIGEDVSTAKPNKKRLTEAMRDVLAMSPLEAKRLYESATAETLSDMIALAMALEAARGGRNGIAAAELLADRTEGKAGITVSAPQNFVEQLIRAFVIPEEKKSLPYTDSEEVEEQENKASEVTDFDDTPIGSFTRNNEQKGDGGSEAKAKEGEVGEAEAED